MTKLTQILILLFVLSATLSDCESKKKLTYLETEEKIFYELFPVLIDNIYRDFRLIPPPPPPPEYLAEKGFDTTKDYNQAYKDWEKSEDYVKRQNAWERKRDSIKRDTTLIYVAIPDSINRFEEEDMYELVDHFNKQKLVIDSNDFDLNIGFKIDFKKLKTNHENLRFKPMSEFPKGRDFWRTKYDFNLTASISFSRILFDETKSFGVLNAGFVEGPLNGSGCRIFIKKGENGKWLIDKIEGTWIS